LNPREQIGFAGMLREMRGVHLRNKIQLRALIGCADFFRPGQVENRRSL